MGNLALNKIPIEKETWNRPEIATNGNIVDYTGTEGFSWAIWPASYTIDFESEQRIRVIRFLLWDNLRLRKEPDARKYKFSLSLSNDGKNFITIYSNQNEDGGNGWYSFRFLNDTYARYVRLTGHHNTANGEFHIVEFEVYDTEPTKIQSVNFHDYNINSGITGEQRISELIDAAISSKAGNLQGVESKISLLNDALKKSNQALNEIELIKKSHEFLKESIDNSSRAKAWLITSISTFIIFFILLLWFIYCDEYSKTIIKDSAINDDIKQYTSVLLGAYYFSKTIILSTILFLLGWFLKNYRSEKHNYVINKHKSMSLTVAISILTKDDFKETERKIIFNQAMEIIFTHQNSGFTKDDGSNPNIVNTLLSKGVSKME